MKTLNRRGEFYLGNHRSIQPDNIATPTTLALIHPNGGPVARLIIVLLAIFFEKVKISELRMKNWVKTPCASKVLPQTQN